LLLDLNRFRRVGVSQKDLQVRPEELPTPIFRAVDKD